MARSNAAALMEVAADVSPLKFCPLLCVRIRPKKSDRTHVRCYAWQNGARTASSAKACDGKKRSLWNMGEPTRTRQQHHPIKPIRHHRKPRRGDLFIETHAQKEFPQPRSGAACLVQLQRHAAADGAGTNGCGGRSTINMSPLNGAWGRNLTATTSPDKNDSSPRVAG